MRELLLCFNASQILFDIVGDKLRAIIVSDDYTFDSIDGIETPEHVDYIDFSDASLKDMINHFATVNINERQQIAVPFFPPPPTHT